MDSTAKRCQIELAYAIGVASPVSIFVNTQGTGALSDEELSKIIKDSFDFRPARIITKLDLLRPIYRQTAACGHFGRTDIDLPWVHTDMSEQLRERAIKYVGGNLQLGATKVYSNVGKN